MVPPPMLCWTSANSEQFIFWLPLASAGVLDGKMILFAVWLCLPLIKADADLVNCCY